MAKLTLSVDDEIIKEANELAKSRGLSVSQMVSTFFKSVTRTKQPPDEMPPILRRLAGVLEKEEGLTKSYNNHVEKKYM